MKAKGNAQRIDWNALEDEHGNLKEEYEIVRYEKRTGGEWVEMERRDSGRQHVVIDDSIFFCVGDALIELNMDFDSPDCGACYQVGGRVEGRRLITGDEFITLSGGKRLHGQSYSDGTVFFTVEDLLDHRRVLYSGKSLADVAGQIEAHIAHCVGRIHDMTLYFYRLHVEGLERLLEEVKEVRPSILEK